MTLNLARRPFANLRPLRRLAVGLWVLGGLATVAAIWLYAAYLSGSAEKRAELGRLQDSGAAESQRIAGLEGDLARFDLSAQNREVAYINDRITERTFAWSALFDDLAQVLPWNVRIESLSPLSIAPDRRKVAAQKPGESFLLRLAGTARDGEALLTFVDSLFAHPAFAEPNLESERRENGEELRFSLTVTYRPHGISTPAQVGPASAAPSPPAAATGGLASAGAPAVATGAMAANEAPPPPRRTTDTPSLLGARRQVVPDGSTVARPVGQETPPVNPAGSFPAAVEPPRGWPGVAAGAATTAEPPTVAAEPNPAAPPLPLAPTMSSSPGIR